MKLTFMCGHYACQFMSKVDQKQNWVKLKVQTMLISALKSIKYIVYNILDDFV